jgi:hypothetical protein
MRWGRASSADQIGTVAVYMEGRGQRGDRHHVPPGVLHLIHDLAGGFDFLRQFLFARQPFLTEIFGVRFLVQVAFHDQHALARVADAANFDREGKPVQ